MYRIPALLLPAVALLVVAAAGCKQTRPIPAYEPLLALEAASVKPTPSASEMYRPAWSGPKPQPRKGGG